MVHLLIIIAQSGPLVGMSCMRYELKNSFYKCCAHNTCMCDSTNVRQTLAHRHQQQSLFLKSTNASVHDAAVVSNCSVDMISNHAFSDTLCAHFYVEKN